jgi:hypothetical protein
MRIIALDVSRFILDDPIKAYIRSFRIYYVLHSRIYKTHEHNDVLDIFRAFHPASLVFIQWANGQFMSDTLMDTHFKDFVRHKMCSNSGDFWVETSLHIQDQHKDKWKFEL